MLKKIWDNVLYFKQKAESDFRSFFLGKYAQGVYCDTPNGLFIVPKQDVIVGKSLGSQGRYGKDILDLLNGIVSPADTVCVLGAHIGSIFIPLAKKVKRAVGYEANPVIFKFLNSNILLNQLTNVEVFNLAVADKQGQASFRVNTVNSGGSKLVPKMDSYAYRYDGPKEITVPMIALDQHTDLNFDLILMDIEGAEFLALKGMSHHLKYCKNLIIEYVPHHLTNVAQITNEEFLGAIVPHFDSMKIIGSDRVYLKNEFLSALNRLFNGQMSADLLFEKILR